MAERDWPGGSLFVAAFVLLVTALLGAVRGWSAPFGAWSVLASCVLAGLALHALAQAFAQAWRQAWRPAAGAVLLACAFAVAIVLVPALGRRAVQGEGANPFGDVLARQSVNGSTR